MHYEYVTLCEEEFAKYTYRFASGHLAHNRLDFISVIALVQLDGEHIFKFQLAELLSSTNRTDLFLILNRMAFSIKSACCGVEYHTSLAIVQYGQYDLLNITTLFSAMVFVTNWATGPDISTAMLREVERNAPIRVCAGLWRY